MIANGNEVFFTEIVDCGLQESSVQILGFREKIGDVRSEGT